MLGIAFVTASLLLPLVFGGYPAVLNIPSWMVALWLPLTLLFLAGTLLTAGGLLRHR